MAFFSRGVVKFSLGLFHRKCMVVLFIDFFHHIQIIKPNGFYNMHKNPSGIVGSTTQRLIYLGLVA
jgi:hypothetical protein